MKKFISGVILFAVILSSTAIAATSSKQIIVEYGINVMVNGTALIPKDVNGKVVDPFVYNGTTYVPIRAISDALGATVGYDGATNSAVITGKPEKADFTDDITSLMDKTKIINEYTDISYRFISSLQNLLIVIAYSDDIPLAELRMIKVDSRAEFNLLKESAKDYIEKDADINSMQNIANNLIDLNDKAVDACIIFAGYQSQDTFNSIYEAIMNAMGVALDLNTLSDTVMTETYNAIDELGNSSDMQETTTTNTQP